MGEAESSSSTQSQFCQWDGTHSDHVLRVHVCRKLILRGSSLNTPLHVNSSGVLFIWRMRRWTFFYAPGLYSMSVLVFSDCLAESPSALAHSFEAYGWNNNELRISFILHHLKYNFYLKTVFSQRRDKWRNCAELLSGGKWIQWVIHEKCGGSLYASINTEGSSVFGGWWRKEGHLK